MSEFSISNPWMRERETILCGWKPDYNRGKINNMNMSMAVDWYALSDRQLREYVRMIKACGFTGIQVMDCCSHWRWFSSYEAAHDKTMTFIKAAKDEGMKITLWVWAANFTGYGWTDTSVRYDAKDGGSAYDDPEVFASFNKYYDIYAEFAPYVDRLILHFFDPGHLKNTDDIIKFAKLIRSKFTAKNPGVKFGIDSWAAPEGFLQGLIDAGFNGMMLMEDNRWPRDKRRAYRENVKNLGLQLGEWSWYLADMEIDQSAWMVVNAKVEKEVYNRIRNDADDVKVPEYWSEIDSYHIMNIFSLYCAGQLLINPDEDPDRLVHDIAYKIYGERHGAAVERVLNLIQDARSGNSWETYWWPKPPRYKPLWEPGSMAIRASECFEELKTVASDYDFSSDFPLPITARKLAELTLPHVEQIKNFAEFYVKFEELEKLADSGASDEELSSEILRIWNLVYDYNTVIGVFGQREARMQACSLYAFCQSHGMKMPRHPLFFHLAKKRYYEYFVSTARSRNTPILGRNAYESNAPYFMYQDEILCELEAEGLITQLPDGKIRLEYFDAYKYN